MNKKPLLVGAAIALLVGIYVAASWQLGRVSHSQFDAWEQKMKEQPLPLVTVAERKYTSGVFSSVEEVTLELNRQVFTRFMEKASGNDEEDLLEEEGYSEGEDYEEDLSEGEELGEAEYFEEAAFEGEALVDEDASENEEAYADDEAEEGFEDEDAEEEPTPFRITIRNYVQHGPLPGLRSIGLARIESKLVFSDEIRQELAKVLGDKDPLVITTLLGFTGAGSTSLQSPAFDVNEEDVTMSWKGFEGRFDYGRNMSSIECALKAPGLDAKTQDGGAVALRELAFDCDMERAFDDLYVGTGGLTIAELRYSGADDQGTIERIVYAADIKTDDEFVDMGVKVGVGSMQMKELTMSDLRYELAFNHLHGPTYAEFNRKIQELSMASVLGDPMAELQLLGAFGEYLPKLLEHSPELVIEHIGFSMPEGEMGLKGSVQLRDFTAADMASSKSALLQKVEATADIWMTEGLLEHMWESDPEQTDMGPASMYQQKLEELQQMGFVERKDGRLQMHVEFKNGELTANGKPLMPGGGN